jgi:putative transcriptional regulator
MQFDSSFSMLAIAQAELADLVRATRQRLEFSQGNFVTKLGVLFQSVKRWGNGRTQPLPSALQQIEPLPHPMGDNGRDGLTKYFSECRGRP